MPQPKEAEKDRRRGGRLRCESVTCELGKVLDISPKGAKIRSRAIFFPVGLGEEHIVRFRSSVGETLPIKVRIVRADPVGLFTREVGVLFVLMDEPRLKQIQ
ncbi:MAG: PilZ domain-containing protein, partial [Planctomycetota bacterium]